MELIGGYREVTCRQGRTVISAASAGTPLFRSDMSVEETDTYLVLDERRAYRPPDEHQVRILTSAFHANPSQPGSILPAGSDPPQVQAVIYDFDQAAISRPEWLQAAWGNIFSMAGREDFRKISSPLLGTKIPDLSVAEGTRRISAL